MNADILKRIVAPPAGTTAPPTQQEVAPEQPKVAPASVAPASVAPASVPVKDSFQQYRRNLPHWRLQGATYFLTWRLHKSQSALQPEERDLVVAALRRFDGQRYGLYSWVVMDDHVHVIVKPQPGWSLSQLTHSWKSFTANQLQRRFGRKDAVWQHESWDRIIRDEGEFWEKVGYILNNPAKRWPGLAEYRWVGWQHPENTGTEAGATSKARPETTGTEAGATSKFRTRHDDNEG